MMKTTEVAILGGGLAGLNAARLLHEAGVSFELLEARGRLGGRILTVDEDGRPATDGFDLGPSWFWPAMQPEMAAFLKQLGLAAFAQNVSGDFLFERSRSEQPHRAGGADFDQGSMRIVGGAAALAHALERGLPAQNLHLNAPVSQLCLDQDAVTLTISRPGQEIERLQAGHVISTLPPRLLAETIGLEPATDRATSDRWRATPTWMAPHAKFIAIYDRPFWRASGLSGMAQSLSGPMGEIHDATTAAGVAALFGFIGVPTAQRAAVGRDVLVRSAVDQLVRLFGPEAGRPRATLLQDWATERFTSTETDTVAAGHPVPARLAWVTGAWADRLTFAGSETSQSEPGYLAGAIEASGRAVRKLAGRVS